MLLCVLLVLLRVVAVVRCSCGILSCVLLLLMSMWRAAFLRVMLLCLGCFAVVRVAVSSCRLWCAVVAVWCCVEVCCLLGWAFGHGQVVLQV